MNLIRSYRLPISILILVGIIFLKYYPLAITATIFIIALLFNAKTVRPLKNYRFWIVIAILVLIVPVFTGEQDKYIFGFTYSSEQLSKTMLMTFRGISVFILFQVLTTDLNIDKIKSIFSKFGLSNFETIYKLSNEIFPKIKSILSARYNLFKIDWRKSKSFESILIFVTDVFNDFFSLTDSLAEPSKSRYKITPEEFVENYKEKSNTLFVIVGDAGIGKTPWIEQVVELLKKDGKSVDGLISKKVVSSNEVWYHDLIRISTNEKHQLTTMDNIKTSTSMGKFNFFDETISWGNDQVLSITDADFVIIDEIGLLEFDGKGFLPGLEYLLNIHNGSLIISLRSSLQSRFDKFLKEQFENAGNWKGEYILL